MRKKMMSLLVVMFSGCVPAGYVKAPLPPEKVAATQADIQSLRKDILGYFQGLYTALNQDIKAAKAPEPAPAKPEAVAPVAAPAPKAPETKQP